jgi:hypothetical protein
MVCNQTAADLLANFQQAVEGLLFPSESDYPIEVALWQEENGESLTPEILLLQTNHAEDSPIATVELESFLRPVAESQSWHGAEEEAIGRRFQQLRQLIHTHLSEVQVYRIGEIEIDVYIIGKVRESAVGQEKTETTCIETTDMPTEAVPWLILSTKVIET